MLQQKFGYPDADGVTHRHITYSGIGYVINQIATSAECANNMAAAYYYDGNQGVFLYTESDVETRSDTYHVTSDVATIPENAYQVTLQKGTGVQSVSGAGSYDGTECDDQCDIGNGVSLERLDRHISDDNEKIYFFRCRDRMYL